MKKLLFFLIIIFCFFSCNMNEIPQAQISKDRVFKSEAGLKMYTNSFYNVFPNRTDIYTNSYYIARSQVIQYFTANGYNAEESDGWSWGELRNINYFIENCTDEAVSTQIRNNYIGIARFFRAYFYFGMMKRFGDLPWIDHALDVDDPLLTAARDSRALIADKIKEDLDFAIENILAQKDVTSSTITSSVAAAFKSRVCLWEGTFRKYHTEAGLQASANDWLQEAVSAAQYVMDAGYTIYMGDGPGKSYRKLFISQVPVASEVLYAVTFDGTQGVIHSGNRAWTSATFGFSPSLTRSFINTYLKLDGSRFTDDPNYKTKSFPEECQNRDLRLAQTIRTPGFTRITGGALVPTAPNYAVAITGYHTSKFTLDDTQFDQVDACDNNIIMFRYAEVLLNYAEAKAEMNSLSDQDWAKTIGVLRARGGITNGLNTKPTTVDTYMQTRFFPGISNPEILEIRRERAVELSFEGFAWSDICRWKVGELVTNVWDGIYIPQFETPYDMNGDGSLDVCFTKELNPTKVPGVYYLYVGEFLGNGAINNTQIGDDGHSIVYMKDQIRTWDNKLYFYPIPAMDLVMNPKLGQNPGW